MGYSWEWLTEVKPYESWKYDAIGKPLWSVAEGRTRFEELARRRAPGSISPRPTTPSIRSCAALFERRVHRFISKDNDRLITDAVNAGIRKMREAPEV